MRTIQRIVLDFAVLCRPERDTLNRPAVDVNRLAVDPTAWAGEERDGLGRVGRLAETLHRRLDPNALQDLYRFALKEQRRRHRTRSHRIHGDIAATQLTSQDQRDRLDRALAGRVRRVPRPGEPHYRT